MSKNPIKALAQQTVVYGMGTIIPRLLNYLLVPLYVRVFASGEYGQITDLYSWMALFMALLTYGMETTFFRYAEKIDSHKAFSNAQTSIITTTTIFIVVFAFVHPAFAKLIHYNDKTIYVLLMGIIVALDALTAIPFARLRKENKAGRFSTIKVLNVGLNIGLNLLFLVVIPETSQRWAHSLFGAETSQLIWVFISNIASSLLSLILLLPQITDITLKLQRDIIIPMLRYAWPILLIGLVGMVNEVSDKILIKYLITIPDSNILAQLDMTPDEYALSQLGIYGANYKLAVLMTIFIQMFRYASEPFFFSHAKDKNAPTLYAKVMTYFVIFCLIIFLGIVLYMDILKYFVGRGDSDYQEGIVIVPIILIANMFYGIVFNLSIWFKLSDKTTSGAIISTIGGAMTLISLFILVPIMGYKGAAWAHLICYTIMMTISYLWGQKVFPIPYQVGRITLYALASALIYFVSSQFESFNIVLKLCCNTALLIIFLAIVVIAEKRNPLKA